MDFKLKIVELPQQGWGIKFIPKLGAAVMLVGIYTSEIAVKRALPQVLERIEAMQGLPD